MDVTMKLKWIVCISLFAGCTVMSASGEKIEKFKLTYKQVIEQTYKPFEGPSNPETDVTTLKGKVMCGYQGWFTCPQDGSGMGWFHWGFPRAAPADVFEPGQCKIDLWPDMTEYADELKVPTAFKNADGSTAYVYTNMRAGVTDLHFKWMKDYGIDGVFVQRFSAQTFKAFELNNVNVTLDYCRAAANKYGRAYALMYDLTSTQSDQYDHIINDVKLLTDRMKLFTDPADKSYLHHNGKPLIAIWGVGFGDNRRYNLKDCEKLIRFLKSDPQYGIFTVMLGTPTFWRQQQNDASTDPEMHRILKMADIVSPWSVGRFGDLNGIQNLMTPLWTEDLAWCKENKLDYLPVVFPGFSWANMHGGKFDQIPRLKGQFLWSQIAAAKRAGAEMVYIAMFDEVDEATAIYKCTNTPPVGASPFLTYEGLPSDFYLRLAGHAGKLMRNEVPLSETVPAVVP
jgi:hypothetical protein